MRHTIRFAKLAMLLICMICGLGGWAAPIEPANDSAIRPGMKPEKLTVIDFNATWCNPCRVFAPAFFASSEKYEKEAVFYSIDVDKYRETAMAFGIESIPTIVVITPDGKMQSYVGLNDFLQGLAPNKQNDSELRTLTMIDNLNAIIQKALKD